MEKLFNFVYITTNLINGKQYVGDHSSNNINCTRTRNYIGSGTYFQNAKMKYGKKNFKREILEFFPTKQEAFDAQEKYIKEYNTLVPNGYNISPKGGCNNGGNHSEITKAQISENRKNKGHFKHSNEAKKKMSDFHKGKKHSEEHKKHLSESQNGRKISDETKKKISETLKSTSTWVTNNPSKTPEHKAMMKKLLTGRVVSKETCDKISKAKTGMPLSNEHKKNIGNSNKLKTYYNTSEFKTKISTSNKGKKRSSEHKLNIVLNKLKLFEEKQKYIHDLFFVLDNLQIKTNELVKVVNLSSTVINRIKKSKTHWIVNINKELLKQYL